MSPDPGVAQPAGAGPPRPEEAERVLLRAADRLRTWGLALAGAWVVIMAAVMAVASEVLPLLFRNTADQVSVGLLLFLGLALLGALVVGLAWAHLSGRQQRALVAELLGAGAWDAAILHLKREASRGDEPTYLVGQAYERKGEAELAVESYREYLRRFPQGRWVVEARVRLRALGAEPAVRARPAPARPELTADLAIRCPYCHDAIGDDTAVRCLVCGTGHHAACMAEAGCAVTGCSERRGARERVG